MRTSSCGTGRLGRKMGSSVSAAAALCVGFFFQAEDGIRDVAVTGVQTCALPISPSTSRCPLCKGEGWLEVLGAGEVDPAVYSHVASSDRNAPGYDPEKVQGFAWEIGRASCRERV